jgi:hypothetical protein
MVPLSLEGLKETMENLSQNNQFSSLESNQVRVLPEYNARALSLEPWTSTLEKGCITYD